MISVIVYGRNDSHGYNLHRRVALTLNCLAEVLTDPADEIIFVDYNTPDELPTAIEALADTLTDRCVGLLRVLRVPASLHTERYGGRTHLAVAEPVARNAAARRSDPANRWLLSTTTDMIFVPLRGKSLSEVCGDLPDGFYGLPRFELPEWVWERLPRADPRRALADVEHLGPALHLDEPTLGDKWVRFDAPGDFQLALRDDFFAIDGFDEEMLLGWHVDANLSRRLLLHRGSIETLEHRIAGYHCNHSRIPTVYHGGDRLANDLDKFFYSVESVPLDAQRATWGLADVSLEEVPLHRQVGSAFVDALVAALPAASGPRAASDAVKASFGATYDSGHVLPFIADSLVVSPLSTIGYLGINPILRPMLERLVDELDLGCDMKVADLTDPHDVEELARSADLFVVDLGTDVSVVAEVNGTRAADAATHIPAGLDLVVAALERLVEVEHVRLGQGAHPRRIVLVNSATVFLDAYASATFDCSSTTAHCRVRRATVKAPPGDEASKSALMHARGIARWALGRGDDSAALRVAHGMTVRFADLGDHLVLADGWAFPDDSGAWTWGSRSELSIAFPPVDDGGCALELLIDAVCVEPDGALGLELLVDGVALATRDATLAPFVWRVELPPSALTAGAATLAIGIDEPRSPLAAGWSTDERPLGLHVRWLALGEVDRSVLPRQRTGFGVGMSGERLLAEGWSLPEAMGVWTDAEHARLVVELDADAQGDAVLVLDAVPFVTTEHPQLTVEVWALDTLLERWNFRHGDLVDRLVLRVPPSVRDERGRTVLDFRFDQPARPADLGLGPDSRRLGIFLRALTLGEVDRTVRPREAVVFGAGMGGERLLAGGWSSPEASGVWTEAERARLVLELDVEPHGDAELVLDVVPFVRSEHPQLTVEVWALDTLLERQTFRHGDLVDRLVVRLPPSVRDENGRTALDFRFDQPARPADLGLGPDERRLGLHLLALMLDARVVVRAGETIDLAQPTDIVGFGKGWVLHSDDGVWTRGDHSALVLALEGTSDSEHRLVISIRDVAGSSSGDERDLELLVNGARSSVRPLMPGERAFTLRVDLPAHVVAEGEAQLAFAMGSGSTAVVSRRDVDTNGLGFRIDAIRLEKVDRSLRLGRAVSFVEGSGTERFLGDGWSELESAGVWTVGGTAKLILQLPTHVGTDLELLLGGHAHVTPGHPDVGVAISTGGQPLGARLFRHGARNPVVRVPLHAARVDADGRVVVELGIDRPASPQELGTNGDPRLLGFHLEWLMVCTTDARGRSDALRHRLRRTGPLRRIGRPSPTG